MEKRYYILKKFKEVFKKKLLFAFFAKKLIILHVLHFLHFDFFAKILYSQYLAYKKA
jgi:hypothetical protein